MPTLPPNEPTRGSSRVTGQRTCVASTRFTAVQSGGRGFGRVGVALRFFELSFACAISAFASLSERGRAMLQPGSGPPPLFSFRHMWHSGSRADQARRWLRPQPWRALQVLGIMFAVFASRSARAEPVTATVVLAFDARSQVEKQVIAAIRAHLSDLPLSLVAVPIEQQTSLDQALSASGEVATSHQALGAFRFEVGADGSLLIFFTETAGETALIRRLRPNSRGTRVALEQAAIVVRSLIEALLEGGEVGVARGAAQSFEPKPKPVPARASDVSSSRPTESDGAEAAAAEPRRGAPAVSQRLAVTAGLTTTQFATGKAWQSGFSAGAHWLATPELYAGARYTFFPQLSSSNADAAVIVGRHPLEVLVGYRETGRIGLNTELGLVADRVSRTTVRTADSLRATAPDARWLMAVAVRGGFSWSPWRPLRASLRVGADFTLTHYAYAVDAGETLLSPAWVRPRVELELASCLW